MLEAVSSWVLFIIGTLGCAGTAGLMFLSAANVPIPSEIIMPFAGFAAADGYFPLAGVIIAGMTGGFCGSVVSYFLGRKLGPKSLDFVSKISLHGKNDFLKAEKWFTRFGSLAVLVGLSLPVVRSFISLPAGIFGVRPKMFIPLAFISVAVWTITLAVLGFTLGENWTIIGGFFRKFDFLIVGLGIVFIAVWVVRHLRPLLSRTK